MAMNGIGAMLSLGLPTATGGVEQPGKAPESAADAAKTRAEAAATRQKATLDEVREKGLYAWAQEQKFEALKAKIEKEMKAAKGISDASLATMTPEERATTLTSLEAEISKRIQEVMQDALTGEAQKAAKEGRAAQPMIIDIAV